MKTLTLSCLIAASGIGLGAFGAHGLETLLLENGHLDTWETAVLYHLLHGVALLALALAPPAIKIRWAARLWTFGVIVFSGTLYVLSVTGIGILGAITPIGGVALIAGWLALAFENRSHRGDRTPNTP